MPNKPKKKHPSDKTGVLKKQVLADQALARKQKKSK